VLLFPGAPVIGGSEQIRALFQRNFAAGANKLTIHGAQMDASADTAVILWVWSFELTPPGGPPVLRTGRSLVFFKRGAAGWLIHADMLQDAPLQ
jgi:ketosteroid isomerase-like protein